MILPEEHNWGIVESYQALKDSFSGGPEAGKDLLAHTIIENTVKIFIEDVDKRKVLVDIYKQRCPYFIIAHGQGLQMTTDGWILTTYHLIERAEKHWNAARNRVKGNLSSVDEVQQAFQNSYFIEKANGERYPLDFSAYWIKQRFDFALIKAIINKEPAPYQYCILDNQLELGDSLNLVRNGNKDTPVKGRVTYIPHSDDISWVATNIKTYPGDSGRFFFTDDCALAGMVIGDVGPEKYFGFLRDAFKGLLKKKSDKNNPYLPKKSSLTDAQTMKKLSIDMLNEMIEKYSK